jgi:hypothetical protein
MSSKRKTVNDGKITSDSPTKVSKGSEENAELVSLDKKSETPPQKLEQSKTTLTEDEQQRLQKMGEEMDSWDLSEDASFVNSLKEEAAAANGKQEYWKPAINIVYQGYFHLVLSPSPEFALTEKMVRDCITDAKPKEIYIGPKKDEGKVTFETAEDLYNCGKAIYTVIGEGVMNFGLLQIQPSYHLAKQPHIARFRVFRFGEGAEEAVRKNLEELAARTDSKLLGVTFVMPFDVGNNGSASVYFEGDKAIREMKMLEWRLTRVPLSVGRSMRFYLVKSG